MLEYIPEPQAPIREIARANWGVRRRNRRTPQFANLHPGKQDKLEPSVTETNYVEVVIDSIRVSLMSQQRIVILREKDAERYLPIWIGPYEAEAITIALQGTEVSRPLTHDLLVSVFRTLNARLVRVEVNSLRDQVYYGNIVAELNGETIDVDSRPSDALALAVRAHIPILVEEEVMEDAGIIPEDNLESDVVLSRREREALESVDDDPGSEERLSVFEDFLEQLDFGGGDIDDDEDASDDDDDEEEDGDEEDDGDEEP